MIKDWNNEKWLISWYGGPSMPRKMSIPGNSRCTCTFISEGYCEVRWWSGLWDVSSNREVSSDERCCITQGDHCASDLTQTPCILRDILRVFCEERHIMTLQTCLLPDEAFYSNCRDTKFLLNVRGSPIHKWTSIMIYFDIYRSLEEVLN